MALTVENRAWFNGDMLIRFPSPLRNSDDPGAGTPAQMAAPPAPTPAPTDPTAARIVVEARRTERELELESQLADTRTRLTSTELDKKAREQRISELEDELHRLKQVTVPASKSNRVGPFGFEYQN